MKNDLAAVRWVGGVEIELLAITCGTCIVPRFEEITADKFGKAGKITEMSFGFSNDRTILNQICVLSKAITALIRRGSRVICDEASRCIHDAIFVVRNMVKNNNVVADGATGIACSIAVTEATDKIKGSARFYRHGNNQRVQMSVQFNDE